MQKRQCQYEKDQLRKKLGNFNRYFNSMKAIANNPCFNLYEAGFNPLGNVRSTELYGSFESLIGNNSSEQRNLDNELVSPANHLTFFETI